MRFKSFVLSLCLLVVTACADDSAPKGVPAKVDTVLKNKVIFHTSEDFIFLDAPSPNWDWRTRFSKGDNVTLMPDKDGKSYSSIILKDGSTLSF